jgi:hypothetical protein
LALERPAEMVEDDSHFLRPGENGGTKAEKEK